MNRVASILIDRTSWLWIVYLGLHLILALLTIQYLGDGAWARQTFSGFLADFAKFFVWDIASAFPIGLLFALISNPEHPYIRRFFAYWALAAILWELFKICRLLADMLV